jgi:hypothetical protein
MKKLIILIVAVLALGAIYIYVLPMLGINTAVTIGDPYKQVVKEREKAFGNYQPPQQEVKNLDPDIESKNNPETVQVAASQLVAANGHAVKGNVEVFSVGGQPAIRYSNFSMDAGTNLRVYLTNSLTINAATSADLGPVTTTSGTAFYRVPSGVNIKQYKYIAIWSVDKKQLFNYAELSIK